MIIKLVDEFLSSGTSRGRYGPISTYVHRELVQQWHLRLWYHQTTTTTWKLWRQNVVINTTTLSYSLVDCGYSWLLALRPLWPSSMVSSGVITRWLFFYSSYRGRASLRNAFDVRPNNRLQGNSVPSQASLLLLRFLHDGPPRWTTGLDCSHLQLYNEYCTSDHSNYVFMRLSRSK